MTMTIPFLRLHPNATMPTKGRQWDAWYDLYSTEDYLLAGGERKLFKIWLAHVLPIWYYGRIADRGGLAMKHGLHNLAWVVDENYRGDIGIVLLNTSSEPYQIHIWDRIAQYVIERYYDAEWIETHELPESNRWEWAYWSSGR
jgi:dUTP pyrophosphatase